MESILILGAGLMQKPAILSAKELGYKVFVVDADKNAVAASLADEFSLIDLKAKEEILEYAKKIDDLKAVFTAGTDFSASVSFVAEKLGLPSHTFEAAQNASNKIRMRGCFSRDEIPSPAFTKITTENLPEVFLKLPEIFIDLKKGWKKGFCLVVKPCDNMGGRGCRMIRSEDEFIPAVTDAVNNSRTGTAILEEYMEGREFSIDAVVYNGTFTVTGFAERHIKYPPYFIEVGHTMPAILPKKIHDELISVFALGAKSLGLTHGVAKADIKYTKKGPMIGEIAGRLSGGYMSGWTYPYASDLNLTKEAILVALGKEPSQLVSRRIAQDFVSSKNCKNHNEPYKLYEVPSIRTCAERAWISIPGTVKKLPVYPKVDSSVKDFLPRATISEGCTVDFPRNNVQKCGNVISVNDDYDEAVKQAHKAVSDVYIPLVCPDQKTDAFLAKSSNSAEDNFPPSAFSVPEKIISKITGTISENQVIAELIPSSFKKYMNENDWNYLTIEETAKKVDELCKFHGAVEAQSFWRALIRGGLQGAVYFLNR